MAFISTNNSLDMDGITPEQKAATKRMEEKIPVTSDILRRVALSIKQEVPDGTDAPGWTYGSCRIVGRIGDHCDLWMPLPEGVNLSDITYSGFYRQTARKEGQPAQGFAVSVPLEFVGRVTPGQCIDLTKSIPFDCTEDELEAMAMESFVALQQAVKEYYEGEI